MPRKQPEPEPEFKRWDLVYVEWIDAGSHDEWTNEDETPFEAVACISAGFLYKKTDRELVITNTRDTVTDNVCCSIVIPAGMIQSIRHLGKVQ